MFRFVLLLVVLALLGAASASSSSSASPSVSSSAVSASPSSSAAGGGSSSTAALLSSVSAASALSGLSSSPAASAASSPVSGASSPASGASSPVSAASSVAPASSVSSPAAASSAVSAGSAVSSSAPSAVSAASAVSSVSAASAVSAQSAPSSVSAVAASSGSAASAVSAAASGLSSSGAATGSTGAGVSGGTTGLTTCVNAGYDLTAITGSDLFFVGTGNTAGTGTVYNWAIRPCGVVTTPGYCSGGEFCQGGTTVSSYNFSGAGVPTSSPIWAQTQYGNESGVAQFLADGTSCGGSVGDRTGIIVYLCNATATTPVITSILEVVTCQYRAIIQTAAICSQVPSTGVTHTPGVPILSTQCGGGVYNLATINGADIIGYANKSVGGTGDYWAIRPCSTLSITNCSDATTSICQFGAGYGFSVSRYNPTTEQTFWQYNAPGVLSEIAQDGDAACTNQYRFTNVTYVCNATATIPVFISAIEAPGGCHYYITIQTSAVCGTAFAVVQPGTASSSGAAASVLSSSAASSVQVSVSSATSPAAAAVASSSAARVASSSATPAAGVSSSSAVNPVLGVSSSSAGNQVLGVSSTSSSTGGFPVAGGGLTSSSPQQPPFGGNGAVGGASVGMVGGVVAVMAAVSLLFA